MPPVGIISVLSQISNPNLEIYAVDENNYRGPRDFTGMPDHKFLQEREPAKIAMFYGGMSNSIPRLFSLAQQYKNFGAITIAGGSHVDALPQEALRSGVDIVVHGEGEKTGLDILETIVNNEEINLNTEKLKEIKGISILDKGEYFFTGKRDPLTKEELKELNDPDLTLVKYLEKKWSAIPVNRGRGCNFNCEFCVVNTQYGKYKAKPIESPLRQIIKYSDLGYKYFFMTDDNFAQNTEETIELCKRIGDYKKKFNKKIELTVQVRSEVAENEKLLEAMKFAGVTTLAIGYESPINKELKKMKKGVTREKLLERSKKLSRDFYLHGMFIFSYPQSENSEKSDLTLKEKAKEYRKFFKEAKIDTLQVLNAVPIPGTPLRKRLEEEKRVFPKEMVGWDKYDGAFLCYDPTPEGIDPDELQNVPRMLMKRWYSGSPINRKINPLRWMDWTYNVMGFPAQFSIFYTKRFVHNLIEKRREESLDKESFKDIFHIPLKNTWKDIKRRWRNLAIETYGRGIVKRWLKEYKNMDYKKRLHEFFSRKDLKKEGN